jgi:hypothetical protein
MSLITRKRPEGTPIGKPTESSSSGFIENQRSDFLKLLIRGLSSAALALGLSCTNALPAESNPHGLMYSPAVPTVEVEKVYYEQIMQKWLVFDGNVISATFPVTSSKAKTTILMLSCPTDKGAWAETGLYINGDIKGFYEAWRDGRSAIPANGLPALLDFPIRLGEIVNVSMKINEGTVSVSMTSKQNPALKLETEFQIPGTRFSANPYSNYYCGFSVVSIDAEGGHGLTQRITFQNTSPKLPSSVENDALRYIESLRVETIRPPNSKPAITKRILGPTPLPPPNNIRMTGGPSTFTVEAEVSSQ